MSRRHLWLLAGPFMVAAVALTISPAQTKVRDDIASPAQSVASEATEHSGEQGSDQIPGDPSAIDACSARTSGYLDFSLVGAFESDVGTVRRWQPGPGTPPEGWDRPDPALFDALSADAVVHVCYLEGEIAVPGPPDAPPAERLALVVGPTGNGEALVAHTRELLPIERPVADS